MSGIWVRLAALAEFGPSRKLVRAAAGEEILLCRSQGQVFALSNVCTHLGQPLAAGRLMSGQIHCPYHGACFDIRTGTALSGPAVAPLRYFPVELRDGEVFVRL